MPSGAVTTSTRAPGVGSLTDWEATKTAHRMSQTRWRKFARLVTTKTCAKLSPRLYTSTKRTVPIFINIWSWSGSVQEASPGSRRCFKPQVVIFITTLKLLDSNFVRIYWRHDFWSDHDFDSISKWNWRTFMEDRFLLIIDLFDTRFCKKVYEMQKIKKLL